MKEMLKHRSVFSLSTLVINISKVEAFQLILISSYEKGRPILIYFSPNYLFGHISDDLTRRRHMADRKAINLID